MSPTSAAAPGLRADVVTQTDLLARVRATRRAHLAADSELLQLAVAWADAHPAADHADAWDEEHQIPTMAWSATAPFAAAIGRSTLAGDALVRDALVLRHRLPRVWRRVTSGDVEAWRARRIAQTVLGQPDDVCHELDTTLADLSHRVGPTTLQRLLDEAMLRLYPEQCEADQLESLDRRHVTLDESSINHVGIAEMTIRADWKDVHDLDQALSLIASALARCDGEAGRYVDSLDVRRARAVGVLADPAAALALLDGRPAPTPAKRTTLVVHISDLAVLGLDPVVRNATVDRAVLDQQARDWCGRTDTHLTVLPVLDLADHHRADAYEVRGRLRAHTDLLHVTCVFPWCTRAARDCDHDHRVPADRGGATCDCNIAPLCRRHHRLKTHAGWTYTAVDATSFLWADPHGQQFLVDPSGTRDVTPSDRPVARGSGCSRAGP